MYNCRVFSVDLKPGMIIAKNIYSDRQLILKKGTVLTDTYITLLNTWNIPYTEIIDIKNSNENGISYEQFKSYYTAAVRILTEVINRVRLFQTLSLADLNDIVKVSENIINYEKGIIAYLAMIQDTDDSIFKHSVTVGILAGLIGKWINCANLPELILAGLLHDVGKIQVPIQILNKPGKLDKSEWKIIKQHPNWGLELVQSTSCLAETVLSGIHQHHERMDGSGYPYGLSGREIVVEAKIIAIADVYDAMTSNRAYRAADTPFQAIEEIHRAMFGKLDPLLCSIFIAKAKESFIGMKVLLSDGSEGTVIGIDKTTIIKPVLHSNKGCYVNLAQRNDLTIVDII